MFRLIDKGNVVMTIVVHVNDVFAAGEKARCNQFARDLGQWFQIWTGIAVLVFEVYCREGLKEGVLKIFKQTFAEQLTDEDGIEFGNNFQFPIGTKLAEFDKNEAPRDLPFRDSVGSLMWLST